MAESIALVRRRVRVAPQQQIRTGERSGPVNSIELPDLSRIATFPSVTGVKKKRKKKGALQLQPKRKKARFSGKKTALQKRRIKRKKLVHGRRRHRVTPLFFRPAAGGRVRLRRRQDRPNQGGGLNKAAGNAKPNAAEHPGGAGQPGGTGRPAATGHPDAARHPAGAGHPAAARLPAGVGLVAPKGFGAAGRPPFERAAPLPPVSPETKILPPPGAVFADASGIGPAAAWAVPAGKPLPVVIPPPVDPVYDQGPPGPAVSVVSVVPAAPAAPGEIIPAPFTADPAVNPPVVVQPDSGGQELNINTQENIIPDPAFIHILSAGTGATKLGDE